MTSHVSPQRTDRSTDSAPTESVAGAPAPVGTTVSVRVPASSGNVGPGFDSLGLALGCYDDVAVTRIEHGLEFDVSGEGSEGVPHSAEHLVIRAMQATYDAAGAGALPGLRLRAHNRIPHGRGMGSSASAVVAGVLAANELVGEHQRLSPEDVLHVCSSLEGHPDNVAPTLYGGLTISYQRPDGRDETVRVPVHEDVVPVVAVPDFEVATSLARGLLPDSVSHRAAAVTAGRAALLVAALSTQPDYLLPATHDLLHQPYRARAMAPSAALLEALRERGYAALISGAGPTVLILARGADEAEHVCAIARELGRDPEIGAHQHQGRNVSWRVTALRVCAEGAKVDVYTH